MQGSQSMQEKGQGSRNIFRSGTLAAEPGSNILAMPFLATQYVMQIGFTEICWATQ